MKTIVIATQKGGSGKTTITAHLAVAAGQAGDGPVTVIDADPQGTLTRWYDQRKHAETPHRSPLLSAGLPAQIEALGLAGYAYCLIDTAPAVTESTKAAIRVADLVLVPTRPSPNDLWSLRRTLDEWPASGVPYVFVLDQAKANTRLTVDTLGALSQYGQVLMPVIHDRVHYAAAMTNGHTAQELSPGGPAAAEIGGLWLSVKWWLGELAKPRELAIVGRDRVCA